MPLAAPVCASRYYQRWTGADPSRAALLEILVGQPLDRLDFDAALARELGAGLPLERAMRRLRNLLVCALLRRDLEGRAELAEVVATMTGFADFAIRTQLACAMAELVAIHGVPTGAVQNFGPSSFA